MEVVCSRAPNIYSAYALYVYNATVLERCAALHTSVFSTASVLMFPGCLVHHMLDLHPTQCLRMSISLPPVPPGPTHSGHEESYNPPPEYLPTEEEVCGALQSLQGTLIEQLVVHLRFAIVLGEKVEGGRSRR